MKKLQEKEIEAKAIELTEKLGRKVVPLVFTTDSKEQIVGYVKKPDYNVNSAAFDKMAISMSSAGEIVLENCLIQEESDPRILQDDDLKFSAVIACVPLIRGFKNEYEKKN